MHKRVHREIAPNSVYLFTESETFSGKSTIQLFKDILLVISVWFSFKTIVFASFGSDDRFQT